MGVLKTFFLYTVLFIVSYSPQLLLYIEPTKSFFDNTSPILILSVSLDKIILAIIIILGIISAILFVLLFTNRSAKKSGIIFMQCIFISIIIILTLLLPITDWNLDILIIPMHIPAIISVVIGIIGAYAISCFTFPNCQNKPAEIYKQYLDQLEAKENN